MKFRGKKPASPATMPLEKYFRTVLLPQPPKTFGNQALISDWNMLGNDKCGDCALASAAHGVMMWTAANKKLVPLFDDTSVVAAYSELTGYRPGFPDTDGGTSLADMAAWRQTKGMPDATGVRHKVDAWIDIKAKNVAQLAMATYLFGAVDLGFQLPNTAEDQFDEASPWDVVNGTPGGDGHCVCCVGRNSQGNFLVITWGRLQAVTPRFVSTYMDEGKAYVSLEWLKNNLSPQGYDEATLRTDAANFAQGV